MALGILFSALMNGLNYADRSRKKAALIGDPGTPGSYIPAENMSGINYDTQGNPQDIVTAGKPGTGLLGSLAMKDRDQAERLAPLLQAMPLADLRKVGLGIAGEGLGKEEQYQIVEGADGYKYWANGPNAGQRVFPNIKAAPRDDKTFEHEQGLRKEYDKASGEFVDMTNSFTRINESVKAPSAAGDLALVFNYMKMLDPASVVRESEFATAQNAAGVPEIVRTTWNRLQSGERLGENQRMDFFDRAKRLYEGAITNQNRIMERYSNLATQYGALPGNIVFDYMRPRETWFQPPTPPSAGRPQGADPLGRVVDE